MYSFPNLEPVRCSMSSSNCCFLTHVQFSWETGKMVWCSHLFKEFSTVCCGQQASLGAQRVKNLPAVWETQVQSLGWEDPREEKWQPIQVFPPRNTHGQRSLVGYNPWVAKESDTTEQLNNTNKICIRKPEREGESWKTLGFRAGASNSPVIRFEFGQEGQWILYYHHCLVLLNPN